MKNYRVADARISILALMALIFLFSCRGRVEVDSSEVVLCDGWEFVIDTNECSSPEELLDSGQKLEWQTVTLPHTPRIEPLIVNDQWQGICWYRRKLDADIKPGEQNFFLRFEGAMNKAEVWLNEKKKIEHYGGYLPFVINISNEMLDDSPDTLYVKLDNRDCSVTGPKPLNQLDFNMYGGIYRDVYLLKKKKAYITDEQERNKAGGGGIFVSYPEVSTEQAVVAVATEIFNASEAGTALRLIQKISYSGRVVAEKSLVQHQDPGTCLTYHQELTLREPQLWSPENPALYNLETLLYEGDELMDRKITKIGIRRFEFINNELFLNGRQLFLRGVNRHQEYPYIGYALSENADYRDARKIKEAGFDFVRSSHYPQSPAFLSACDELGLVVLDAILGWQYFSEDEFFKENIYQSCRDLLRRDRNHPCVIAWELSLNESGMSESFIDSLIEIGQEEYPFAYSYIAGWMPYGYDIYIQARQHRLGHEDEIPAKPYMVSEYGDWEYFAMNAGFNQEDWLDLLPADRSSRQAAGAGEKRLLQQARNIQEAHNDNLKTRAVADGYWVMFDYNRGYADDLETSGLMSIFRQPKFAAYFFRSQRDPGDMVARKPARGMVFIAAYFENAGRQNITVFSNCDEVELFNNDRSLGVQLPDTGRTSEMLRHPPFTFNNVMLEKGELLAIGRVAGEETARYRLNSPLRAERIELQADFSGRQPEKGRKDFVFISARVCDRNGQTVYSFPGEIHFKIEGAGRIIGPSIVTTEAGFATILAETSGLPGAITVTAGYTDLEDANLTFLIK